MIIGKYHKGECCEWKIVQYLEIRSFEVNSSELVFGCGEFTLENAEVLQELEAH